MVRGVSNARKGSKIPFFLFRPRLVCSSLLHLRSSWKVNSANYFALWTFSEVLHSPGPMQQGFSCGIGDWKLYVHTFSAKLAPNSQKCCGKLQICRKSTSRPSKFIQNSSPLGNKAGMTKTERGAMQHGRASSTYGIHPPRSIAWGCEPLYDVFVARYAHPCVR
jgi:hypothetical protein